MVSLTTRGPVALRGDRFLQPQPAPPSSQRIRYPPTLATDKLTIDKDLVKTYCGGFELIGLLAIFDPPRDNDKQTINDAIALGV
ncbi:plasma membrane H(+)-ATPase, putative, partial [Rhizoctonia solani AG-3 Rhs1AP]